MTKGLVREVGPAPTAAFPAMGPSPGELARS
jgi:hypothetical protein